MQSRFPAACARSNRQLRPARPASVIARISKAWRCNNNAAKHYQGDVVQALFDLSHDVTRAQVFSPGRGATSQAFGRI